MSDILYPIGTGAEFTEWAKYYPGVLPSGEQVILFQKGVNVHAYRFDAAVNYLGRTDRTVADGRAGNGRGGALAWAEELRMTPATIRIKRFHTPYDGGPTMCIQDHPVHHEDDLGNDEERAAILGEWERLGAFVMFQGTTEHWIDRHGERFQ